MVRKAFTPEHIINKLRESTLVSLQRRAQSLYIGHKEVSVSLATQTLAPAPDHDE